MITLLLLLAGCDSAYDYPTQSRELWSGQVGDIDVVLAAQLRGWHRPKHLTPNYTTIEARDVRVVYWVFEATRSGAPVVQRNTGNQLMTKMPADQAGAQSAFEALKPTLCPVESGVAFNLGEQWQVLWSLGDELIIAPLPDLTGRSCDGIEVPERVPWLAAHPGKATVCLRLDQEGHRGAALECILNASTLSLHPIEELPENGPLPSTARLAESNHFDALEQRLVDNADPEAAARLEELVLAHDFDAASIGELQKISSLLDSTGRRESFVRALLEQCANPEAPCGAELLQIGRWSIMAHGWSTLTPEECSAGSDAIEALRRRGGEEGVRAGYAIASSMFMCEDPPIRALMLDGLDVLTQPDRKLKSPSYSSYGSSTSSCQVIEAPEGAQLGAECGSVSRFAGTWLALHCDEAAIERAKQVEAGRPREPYDIREDQVLDGALRVLGACDEPAFEAAIAHLPETVPSSVNTRSRAYLRKALLGPPHRSI